MNLNIDRFVTRCQVPKRSVAAWQGLDRVVRERFPQECRREISARVPESTRVIRIRRLLIRLQLSGQFDGERLARAWSEAFARALLAAINSPSSSENEVVHARTRAEWLARFISDVISGSAAARWEYQEFKEPLQLGTADCVLMVFSQERWEIVSVLLLLDDRQRFQQLLLLFDDFRLEKLFSLLASVTDEETNEPTVDDLLTIGALVISQSSTRGRLATRQRALRIFLALSRTRKVDSARVLTPRLVLHALMTFDALAELTQSLPPESWFQVLAPESLARRQRPTLHAVVLEVIAKLWALATQMDPGVQSQKLQLLSQLLLELSPVQVVTSSSGEKVAHWVSSDCAGLMLLAGLVDRLGWVQRIRISSLGLRLESWGINFCLAALAVRLLGQSEENHRPDRGLLLFAGWPDPASVDLTGFRNFLVSLSETEQNDLLDLLTDTEENDKDSFSDWRATFDCLAGVLTREFSGRVRGFRKANPAFVIKTFFSQPGRIFIDDKRILVILQANPFHIALHISSMDEAVESISWLGGRRLEFQLEGL